MVRTAEKHVEIFLPDAAGVRVHLRELSVSRRPPLANKGNSIYREWLEESKWGKLFGEY